MAIPLTPDVPTSIPTSASVTRPCSHATGWWLTNRCLTPFRTSTRTRDPHRCQTPTRRAAHLEQVSDTCSQFDTHARSEEVSDTSASCAEGGVHELIRTDGVLLLLRCAQLVAVDLRGDPL